MRKVKGRVVDFHRGDRLVRSAAKGLLVFMSLFALAAANPAQGAPRQTSTPEWVGGSGGVFYRNMVVVLTWHDVGRPTTADTIPTAAFEQEMTTLRSDHFHPVSAAVFAAFVQGKKPVPPNAVLLTFDNGDEGVWQNAFPILKRERFPFLLFPILQKVGRHPYMLTRAQLRALAKSPLVTIGSHTYQEHTGAPISPNEALPSDIARIYENGKRESLSHYDARVLADARLAQAFIRHYTGKTEPYFSDPFGQYTPRLIRLIREAGFTYDFTTLGWAVVAGAPADRLPRINVGTSRSTAQSMVGGILTVAKDTAKSPSWHPPARHIRIWP